MEEAKMSKAWFMAGMRFLAGTVATTVLPIAAYSADLAKEGTDSTTNIWMMTSPTNPIKLGDRTVGTYELSGIRHADNRDAVTKQHGNALPRNI
jgi:hypothetical protein